MGAKEGRINDHDLDMYCCFGGSFALKLPCLLVETLGDVVLVCCGGGGEGNATI